MGYCFLWTSSTANRLLPRIGFHSSLPQHTRCCQCSVGSLLTDKKHGLFSGGQMSCRLMWWMNKNTLWHLNKSEFPLWLCQTCIEAGTDFCHSLNIYSRTPTVLSTSQAFEFITTVRIFCSCKWRWWCVLHPHQRWWCHVRHRTAACLKAVQQQKHKLSATVVLWCTLTGASWFLCSLWLDLMESADTQKLSFFILPLGAAQSW